MPWCSVMNARIAAGSRLLGRELEPRAHVAADDRRAGVRLELVVRVAAARLVLDEVLRLRQLADVVIVGADAGRAARSRRSRGTPPRRGSPCAIVCA